MEKENYKGIYNRFIKRVIDFTVALVLFIITLPLFIIISIIIAIDSGFPIFYKPLRDGYQNKPFHIYKFRTMVKDADKGDGTTALNDPRITRAGKVLRKLKLDEIPQLINVLNSTMSFIGPRPELLKYTKQYTGEEKLILQVRPGITDFSSIEFINLDEIVGEENPDEILLIEIWESKKHQEIHIEQPHMAKLRELKPEFVVSTKLGEFELK